MVKIDRRTTLKSLGAAALSPWLDGCASSARAPAGLRDVIDTVVVLMMENRSFDHYFGALSLEEGRADVDGLTADMFNETEAGERKTPHRADATCILDPPHGWNSSRDQLNGGRNDGFVRAHEARHGPDEAHRVMGYFGRETLSALYGLADEYTLCQRWFASVLGSTWPNRFYSHAGQNGGYKSNTIDGDYSFPNLYDRLDWDGLSWATYYGNVSFLLLLPRDYGQERFRPLERFYDDAAAGTLPNVTIVEPIYGRNDDHPPTHPKAGQVLISSVYDALANSPQWERTLLIITYDEHGGFFDHVAPPTTEDRRAEEGFDQLGFRVPSLIVGPYARQGFVSSTPYEHTSILAFIETLFDLLPLTERDGMANNLTDALDPRRIAERAPRAPVVLPQIIADEREIYAAACVDDFINLSVSGAFTGQPELEQFLDAHPRRAALDFRRKTDATYDWLLDLAERRGLLRRSR